MSLSLPALITDLSRWQWADLALIPILILIYFGLCWIWPSVMLRPLWWLITHTIYRLRVHGRVNIPREGPALIVCNHVSFVDWMLIWVACPRKVRFLASSSHSRNPLLAIVLKMVRTIPIDDDRPGPRALVKAFRECANILDQGEVLCVFAEGQLTRNGFMMPFHRGFERILKLTKSDVPIIPAYVAHIWGSVFSYRGGKMFAHWPSIPYPVAVGFGTALPKSTPASEVRLAVQEVSADVAIAENKHLRLVHRQFVRIAAKHPFRICYIDTSTGTERKLNYAKAYAGAVSLRRWLKERLGEEQYVGLWLPSTMAGALANIALAFLGKTSVNLNYTAGQNSIDSAVRQTKLKQIITSKRFLKRRPLEVDERIERIYLEDSLAEIGKWERIRSFLAAVLLPGWILDHWVLGLGSQSADDVATVIFSSGTTGDPKGILLSFGNIGANIESLVSAIDLQKSDRLLGKLPFFHSFGYTITLWGHLQVGASVVYWPDPRQAQEIGELARKYQPTIGLSTATFTRFYIRKCKSDNFRSLRIYACGAEKLPIPLADEFEKKFGFRPLEGFGCTELAPAVSVNVPDREVNGVKQIGTKIGTIGQPLPGVAVKILDPETEERVPIGEAGLLWVKGANVMVGYLNQPEKTASVIKDGWYNTGDMAKLDEDGFITITGRLSRFAKIGGEMIPLQELEEHLHAVIGSAEQIFAVTSIPHEKRGERIIVLHLPVDKPISEIIAGLRERGLPNLWVPAERDFFPVEELPVLGSGKLDLRAVQDLAKKLAEEQKQGE